MRVRILRGTALGGVGNDAYPGEVRDIPAAQAAALVAAGRAEALPDEPADLVHALNAVQEAQHAMVAPAPTAPPRRARGKTATKD